MLGTGIASAHENVNPDTPPVGVDSLATLSPQAGGAAPVADAPVQARNNTVNSPLGNVDLPSAEGRAQVLPGAPDKVNNSTQALLGTSTVAENGLPVQLVNNQVGVAAPAHASGDFGQQYTAPTPVTADGAGQTLQGNVIRSQNLAPLQLANNAVAVANNSSTEGTVSQTATGGGDINTSGRAGTVSGTIADQRSALPIGLGGSAVAVGGNSKSGSCTSQNVVNNGKDTTDGALGTLAGTAANIPVALPAVINSNAVSGLGRATSAHTSGGQVTGPNSSSTTAIAAGDVIAKAPDSILSGTIASTPVSTPAGVYGNEVNGAGAANAQHTGSVLAIAGPSTYGDGSGGIGSGTTVATPVASVVDVACSAASAVGSGQAGCDEARTVTAGFYNGSLGNGAILGGNVAQTPTVLPVETLSNAVGAAGDASSMLNETKQINAGWSPNSNDDNGKLSSNVVQAANAVAAEVNTLGVGVLGDARPSSAITVIGHAGQPAEARGVGGTGSGNVVNESAAYYGVVEGVLAAAGGNAHSFADNSYNLVAQGPVHTSGENGILAGNIVPASVAGGTRVGGWAVSAVGTAAGELESVGCTTAGGPNSTDGDAGVLSGNILPDVPVGAPVDLAGHAISAAGRSYEAADVLSALASGGDGVTSGDLGTLSGNILSAPVGAAVDWFGDATNVAGQAFASAVDIAPVKIGGDHRTSAVGGSLSGNILNPGAGLLTGIETDAIGTGPAVSDGVGGFAGRITGENSTHGGGLLNGVDMLSPLPIHAAFQELTVPLGQPVHASLLRAPQTWLDPSNTDIPLDLMYADAMPAAAALPQLAGVTHAAQLTKGAKGDLPGVTDLGNLTDLIDLADLGHLGRLADLANLDQVTDLPRLAEKGLPVSDSTQGLPLPVPLPTSMGLPEIDDLGALDGVLGSVNGGGHGGDAGLPLGDTSNLLPLGDLSSVAGGLGGGLPVGGLTGGALPVGGLTGGLPVGGLGGGLPLGGASDLVPLGDLSSLMALGSLAGGLPLGGI